ncbi:efflux RND transporter permease subunit [Microbacterium sp.]|uniref:efflux RND transporter permease subunit n=1 Tax=Microbacterium sp. TaxID=51671 RepID=UPI00260EA189|nr:efflux RND transporter permease subunit [Microbacterium sp.]MCV0334949.1 efflux RND transporter permease subunit [Microbacterium sp.]MCV0373872.1 efflux RND transporter permease subunit [Microbacterium sp.]MCV0391083.1 efflux RND transporter permease subunit [Microbacterium sp.]MCV0418478.1 efflux RND transporter permease subunit [Microbacterium sp.]MCV0422923.1 efflux RND transporter permease subunit [Microbacterium sp.]
MSFLTRSSLKNRLILSLATLAVVVLGLISMGSLKQELMPSLQAPMAFISAQSQGLAPEEMASSVTEPLEQAVRAVPGVTSVTSTTSSGNAQVLVEWTFGEDDEETLRTIRSAAESLKPSFPSDTEVSVASGGAGDLPAMALSAGTSGDQEAFGDALQQTVVPALKGVPGVRDVTLAGQETQRITIDLRPADVTRLKVEPSTLGPILEAHGAALPAGQADSTEGPLSITVGSRLATPEDIQALPVPTSEGAVTVAEFADVTVETVPAETISRVNGKPSLTLQVMPAQGANVVDISHGVNAELDRLAPILDAEFVTIFDQAPYIEQSIHDLSVEGGLGLLFAVLVILAFLRSWRSTVIAAVSIPLSLLITLVGLWWSGNTLNILTLGALTIAIGRVVDDSIVVIENISRRRGDGPLTIDGIVASVRQVAGAITASTLTTVAVFLPIAFVSGIAGQLFRPFAVTVSIALLASLVVSLTIVPVLASWFLNKAPKQRAADADTAQPAAEGMTTDAAPAAAATAVAAEVAAPAAATVSPSPSAESDVPSELDEIHTAPDRLQRTFMPALNATRRHPVITLVASALLLVATLGMTPFIQTDFLGSSGQATLQVVQTPPKEATADLVAAAEPVEKTLGKVPGIADITTSIPVPTPGTPASITYDLRLKDGSDVAEVESEVQKALDGLPDSGEIDLASQDASLAGAGDGIDLQIQGNDPAALRTASDLLEKQLADADGVRSVKSELAGEQPVLRVKVDEPLAARLGFDRATIAKAVQEALSGTTVGTLMYEGRERDIVVRTPGAARPADKIGEIMLPVTPQQTAEAQKAAADALQAKAEAKAAEAKTKAENELNSQINTATKQRAELAGQIGALNRQLAELSAAPIVPEDPLSPDEEAVLKAQTERAEQLAALQGAIEGAQSGVAAADEQIKALRQSRSDAAAQQAEADAAEAEQKAAAEVTGTAIPLAAIATVEEELTAPTITRAEGERQVTLTVTPEKGGLAAAGRAIDKAIADTDLPAGVTFQQGGASAQQDEAFSQLGLAMLAAIVLVLLVMVATFRNFRGPLVLLISIPFAATGAILGLLLTGTPMGLPALIGLLMLIGIVVTNAIVLMDLVNRLRGAGASLDEAVEHGTRLRLRPILMTAAATVFALVPMSLGLTGGGVFISKPLAIVVIGGLVSSTLLTLVLVPVLYTLVERSRERRIAKRAARRARREERRAASAETSTDIFEVTSEKP